MSKKNKEVVNKENEKKVTTSTKEGVVIVGRLNVREAPELNAKIIGELVKNQKVEVMGIDKDFYKLPNGYAMQKFIKI